MIAAIELDGVLGDATYLAITVALFGVARLMMAACQRIAGDDDVVEPAGRPGADGAAAAEPGSVAA